MRTVIYVPFALSLAFVGLSRLVCRRTSPRPAAWSVAVAMVVLAGSTVAALGLLAWPLAARLPMVAHLGGWQPDAVNHGVPVPELESIVASLVLAAIAATAFCHLSRLRGACVEISTMHVDLGPAAVDGLVVIDDPQPGAHALPATLARRGVVVVSTGMLEALDDDERVAVLAHERAHLAHAHRLFLVVAGLAAALNPLLVSCRGDLAFALERWADEDAARRSGRTVTARALAKASLAKLATLRPRISPSPFLGPNGGLAMELVRLGVPHRVAALLEPEPRGGRTWPAWLPAGLAVIGIVAVVWATRDTEHLFELLQAH